jgi:alpha-L-fucosidase 2
MKNKIRWCLLVISILFFGSSANQAQEGDILAKTSSYNIVWDTPSVNSLGSMPIGNGDIGMNVWVEGNGDLFLYLSKTDAWSENGQLLKLGKIRINLDPSPFASGKPFRQELKLTEGEIVIQAGKPAEQVNISVRIDANHPVAEIIVTAKKPVRVKVELLPWRTVRRAMTKQDELMSVYGLEGSDESPVYQEADHFPAPTGNRITWYHRNDRSVWKENLQLQALGDYASHTYDPLFYLTFGASIEGAGLKTESATVLSSDGKIPVCTFSIYPLTAVAITEQDWMNQLDYGIARIKSIPAESRLNAHLEWWKRFWTRSYIFVSSPAPLIGDQANTITRGYILQRFINACGGRGHSPIKFNGSIFTTDTYNRKESNGFDADFRRWGGPFWFQNTRLPYWSMLECGDFEMMKPLFNMYIKALPIRQFATKKYYNHAGAFFPETMNFWGTWTNTNYGSNRQGMPDGLTENTYIRYYWTGGLELSLIMLDYYDFTRSEVFKNDTLVPFVSEILEFYDKHWRRDIDGKILFTPAQSLETYQTAVNPTPDIAGLRFVTAKMLGLKGTQISPEKRKQWENLLASVPEIPTRLMIGDKVIAPAAFSAQESNIENPGLYAVFPFRLYGVGKPDIDLAISTFATRKFRFNQGWQQSAIQAAYLGLANEASTLVLDKFSHSDKECRFPAFWGPNYDWSPDQDHGSVAMIALQRMVLQYEGDSLVSFPAWPEEWDVQFRLRAPGGLIAEGSSVAGKRSFQTVGSGQ